METFAILRNCGYKIYHIGQFWHIKSPEAKEAFGFHSYRYFKKAADYFTQKEIKKHEN